LTLVTFSDLETTGKLKPEHRIIEASFRVCELESQKELANHLFRFNPERNIDAKAQAVHGISLEDLKHEPTFKLKIPEMKTIIGDTDLIVFHNGISFDWPYLKQEFETNGDTLPDIAIFDTMVEGTFATDLGKSPTLSELCWSLDVDYDSKMGHRGDYDTAVLRDCFFNAIRYGWFQL
jgi:DNA polymerase-3 subunit epsilon